MRSTRVGVKLCGRASVGLAESGRALAVTVLVLAGCLGPGRMPALAVGSTAAVIQTQGCTSGIGVGAASNRRQVLWSWGLGSSPVMKAMGVTLLRFEATGAEESIVVSWETASETNNLGFNLRRAVQIDGPKTQINAELIPSLVSPGGPVGASYEYVDTAVTEDTVYFYWLEMVDVYGQKEQHGPASARVGAPQDYRLFLPLVIG